MTHHGLPAAGGGEEEEEERHMSTEKIPRDGMPADAPTDSFLTNQSRLLRPMEWFYEVILSIRRRFALLPSYPSVVRSKCTSVQRDQSAGQQCSPGSQQSSNIFS